MSKQQECWCRSKRKGKKRRGRGSSATSSGCERRVKDEGDQEARGVEEAEGRRWNARFSKEELSAVKNHAPRHHVQRASALHTLALNLLRWRSSSFAHNRLATPIILYSPAHLRLPPSPPPSVYIYIYIYRHIRVSLHRHRFSMFARRLISLCSFRLERELVPRTLRYLRLLRDIPLRERNWY